MMSDYMEVGHVIPLENGWYLDAGTKTKFRVRDDGSVIDENGSVLVPAPSSDDDD